MLTIFCIMDATSAPNSVAISRSGTHAFAMRWVRIDRDGSLPVVKLLLHAAFTLLALSASSILKVWDSQTSFQSSGARILRDMARLIPRCLRSRVIHRRRGEFRANADGG
jgi:hypothetical protein